MSRKHKELPVIKEVTITDVAAEGKAIVKSDDIVIFTQYTVPGDVVDLQITKKKKMIIHALCPPVTFFGTITNFSCIMNPSKINSRKDYYI